MPYGRVSARVNSPTVAVFIDMGNPLLNRTVGASHVVVEEAYSALEKGTVAGVYTGMEYGFERVRGKRDWILIALAQRFKTRDLLQKPPISTP